VPPVGQGGGVWDIHGLGGRVKGVGKGGCYALVFPV